MSIDIAIIDSGVNPGHSHVQGVVDGVSFKHGEAGNIIETNTYPDQLGHGTAITGIIRELNPAANLYAIKIFHDNLSATVNQLLAAIRWAIRKKVSLIHLSLGLENEAYRQDLERLCRKAFETGTIVVASARGPDDHIYPGIFETVIGVYWCRECETDDIVYHPESDIEFGAHGHPRPLPGMPQERNFRGSSFAAARVTAIAARYLARNPAGGLNWVKNHLIKKATEAKESHGKKAFFT